MTKVVLIAKDLLCIETKERTARIENRSQNPKRLSIKQTKENFLSKQTLYPHPLKGSYYIRQSPHPLTEKRYRMCAGKPIQRARMFPRVVIAAG